MRTNLSWISTKGKLKQCFLELVKIYPSTIIRWIFCMVLRRSKLNLLTGIFGQPNRIFVIACSMTAINNIEVILYIFARFRHLNVRQQSLFIWRFFIDVHDVHLRRIFSFKYNIPGLLYKSIKLVFSRRTRPSVNKKARRYNGNYHHSVHLLPQRR